MPFGTVTYLCLATVRKKVKSPQYIPTFAEMTKKSAFFIIFLLIMFEVMLKYPPVCNIANTIASRRQFCGEPQSLPAPLFRVLYTLMGSI